MKKHRNNSIDILRLICALLVVAIHTEPFMDTNKTIGYVFTNILPRIAVPFFFAISGYYYIQNLEKSNAVFKKYIKHLLMIYAFWSIIYLSLGFLKFGRHDVKGYFIKSLYGFFISGSYNHLWFFPALIFSVCFVTLLFKAGLKKIIIPLALLLFIIGCLCCSYYNAFINIPIMNKLYSFNQFTIIRRVLLMGLPFFISGYLVYILRQKFAILSDNKKSLLLTMGSVLIWIIEIILVIKSDLQENILITIALLPLVVLVINSLLNNPLENRNYLGNKCKKISDFTYYIHPLFLSVIRSATTAVFGFVAPNIILFLITSISSIIVGYILSFSKNKFMNTFII